MSSNGKGKKTPGSCFSFLFLDECQYHENTRQDIFVTYLNTAIV